MLLCCIVVCIGYKLCLGRIGMSRGVHDSILPFGMWCLSACKIMFVSVVFAVCGLMNIFAFLKAASVSSVNLSNLFFYS